MEYFVNGAARAMRSGQFNCISLLQSTCYTWSMLPNQLMGGIQKELAEHGKHLLLSELPDEKLVNEGFVPKILTELFADGLLVNYNTSIPQKMIRLIMDHHIPSVWINSKQKENCVHPDDYDGGIQAAEYLLKLGHHRIAFAGYTGEKHYSAKDRFEGYSKVMIEAGLKTQLFEKNLDLHDVGEFSIEMLSQKKRPTAVICYTEKEFLGMQYAANKLGLKLPEDLSLVVFNPVPLELIGMFATTVVLPEEEIGRTAVKLLLKLIEDPSKSLKPVKIKCELKIGNTTSCIN